METNKLTEVFNNLQRDGINARIKNRKETLLIWATSEGYTEIALALIKAGANLDDTREDGNTALLRAACEGRFEIAQALIAAGANLDIQNDDGYSALILAKRRGNMDIYDLLIDAKADQTLETSRGVNAEDMGENSKPKTSLTAPKDEEFEQQIIEEIELRAA